MSEKRRCHWCEQMVTVTTKGKLRVHVNKSSSVKTPLCPGSGHWA